MYVNNDEFKHADNVITEERHVPGSDEAEQKRRMLIVDDNAIDHTMLQCIFSDCFVIEKAKDGATALSRLKYYGNAISVVLLDLMMPGMDGFEVLERMQESAELRAIPVIIVSGDESRDTCLKAVRKGATDFITKPVNSELLRVRVQSAVSRAENERLRAKNRLLELQNEERLRYESVLDGTGVTFVEYNWLSGEFFYYPSMSRYLFGKYDDRPFFTILTADGVTDEQTVAALQDIVQRVAESVTPSIAGAMMRLKTADGTPHTFRVTARRLVTEHQFTNRIIITLNDIDYVVDCEC